MIRLGVGFAVVLAVLLGRVPLVNAQSFTPMSQDMSCQSSNSVNLPSADGGDEGEPYYRSPNALNSYPTTCGLFVELYPAPDAATPATTSIVVDLIAGRTTDPTTCSKIELTARLWKTLTNYNLSTSSPMPMVPVSTKTVTATWDGTRCKAPVTFSKSLQVTQADIDAGYENRIQARAIYRTSTGAVVRVPFMVRTTFTSGKWTIPASSATTKALGVSIWKIWFTRARENFSRKYFGYPSGHYTPAYDPDTQYGGDPSQGGQPLDFAGNDYRTPSRNYHIRDTLVPGEDNSAIVMQGFDAAGQYVGFISYRLNKGGLEHGTESIAYGNRNDSGWWSDTIESDKPLRESFRVWAAYASADLDASRMVVGFSCEKQVMENFYSVLGCAAVGVYLTATALSDGVTAALVAPALAALERCRASHKARTDLLECRGVCPEGQVAWTVNGTGDKACATPGQCADGTTEYHWDYTATVQRCPLSCPEGKTCKFGLKNYCPPPCFLCPYCE